MLTDIQIFPPILEGTVPAFVSSETSTVIRIPFKNNPGNPPLTTADKWSAKVLVKSITTNQVVLIIESTNIKILENIIECTLPGAPFKAGNYYKFQVAFIQGENVGFYSTPAIGKYLGDETTNSVPQMSLTGTFRLDGAISDPTIYTNRSLFSINFDGQQSGEFLYSSRVQLMNWNKTKTYYDSGEKLYDSSKTDNRGVSHEDFYLKYDLTPNIQYKLIVSTMTGNLYYQEKEFYLKKEITKPPQLKADLMVNYSKEEGVSNVILHTDNKEPASAEILLLRSCSDTNFSEWEPIKTIRFNNYLFTDLTIYQDFFVEYGKIYIYAFQQIGRTSEGKITYSSKKASQMVQTYFEHMYLTDGKKQLKIKFNPKVSSFKYNILENKVNTIGGKYPFVFRNNQVRYAEFPVSGLISYLSDEANLFLPNEDELFSVQLDDENFFKEKIFKDKCLEWLTDGKVKYFKSPAEGSFLVRLLNVSLSPNDTVSRMIFSFNSTAVEIGEVNYANLTKFNLFDSKDKDEFDTAMLIGSTYSNLSNFDTNKQFKNIRSCKLNNFPVNSSVVFSKEIDDSKTTKTTIEYKISGPPKVNYDLNDFDPGIYTISFSFPETNNTASIDLVYEADLVAEEPFDYIITDSQSIVIKSFDGIEHKQSNIYNPMNFTDCAFIYFLSFTKRQPLAYQGVPSQNQNLKGVYFHDGQYFISEDGISEKPIDNPYTLKINGSIIDISHTNEYYLEVLENVQEIVLGYGVKLDCGYSQESKSKE